MMALKRLPPDIALWIYSTLEVLDDLVHFKILNVSEGVSVSIEKRSNQEVMAGTSCLPIVRLVPAAEYGQALMEERTLLLGRVPKVEK